MVNPELLAVTAAVVLAIGSILMKQGLRTSTRATAVFVTIAVQAAIFVSLTVAFGADIAITHPQGALPFIAAGIIGSVGARFLITTSVDVIGVARALPVRSTSPVFSAAVAILVLGERVSVPIAAGTGLVVVGIAVLTYEAYSDRGGSVVSGRRGLISLAPVLAGSLLLGLTPTLRKSGLEAGTSVLGGLALNFASAFALFGLYYAVRYGEEVTLARRPARGVTWFAATGVCWSIGFVCYFVALQQAPTVVVVPLFTTTPLFAIALSWLFLNDIEQVTPGVLAGGILAVLGAALVVVG